MPRTRCQLPCGRPRSYGAVAFFVVLAAFPFYWMVITSFKTEQRSLQRHQYPVLVQRTADARAFPLSVRADPVRDAGC